MTILLVWLLAQPAPEGMVTDAAGKLSPSQKRELTQLLEGYRQQTSNEIAVLLVRSTGGTEIRQYGIQVAEKWKVGKAGRDNGVIFIIAVEDRVMSIEVGRGLEGNLTDLQASYIIREVAPYFQRQQYFEGIHHGLQQIIKAISGQYTPPAHARPKGAPSSNWVTIVIIIFVLLMIFGSRRSGSSGCLWFLLGTQMGGGWGHRRSWGGSSGGGGFGGFGGGGFGGGGASGRW